MTIGKINFGARISETTFSVLKESRKKGLDTSRMEDLMKEVYPQRVIYTTLVDNEIDSNPNKGIKTMEISSPYGSVPILDMKIKDMGYAAYYGAAYKINQKTVDLITRNLEMIKSTVSEDKPRYNSEIEEALVEKLGEPIAD